MPRKVWHGDDMRNMLLSLSAAAANTLMWRDDTTAQAYRAGYVAALVAVALAAGIDPAQIGVQVGEGSEQRGR